MFAPTPFPTKARKMLTSGLFLLVFGSCFSIFLTLAYASLSATPQDRFLTLSTLGSDMSVGKYYPTDSPFVGEAETMNWNVAVYNHMGEPEYVAFRVKLLNATQFGPDGNLHLPSPSDYIYEERHLVANNATWTAPLTITLRDLEVTDGNYAIRTIEINGKEITNLNVENKNSNSFRFVIELWRYDVKFQNFVFTWPSGPESGNAWNQILIQIN
ncbi:MAG: hypothetical protein MN733_05950 [Nitrososphaera sp.]|nr:hypothetical protein [Nitrososphaera sp.]